MHCPNCESSFLFVFPGETAHDSLKRCCSCSFESPLSPEDWLEHQADENRSSAVGDALALIRAGNTEEAARRLVALVDPADRPQANRALRALGSTQSEAAVAALDDIAGRCEGAIRDSALLQLGALRLESAARCLLGWYDTSEAVRGLASKSLVSAGDAAVTPLSERLAECRPGDGCPWERMLADIDTPSAREALVRWRVATCLEDVAREQLTPVDAGDRLRDLGVPAAAALTDSLRHDNSRARLAALRALVQMGGKAADDALEYCRHDPANEVADYAAYELRHQRETAQAASW